MRKPAVLLVMAGALLATIAPAAQARRTATARSTASRP